MHFRPTAIYRIAVATLAVVMGLSARAAEVPADSTGVWLDEVTVTGIKSTLPGSINAVNTTTVTSTEVEQLNIATMRDAAALVPNFYVPDYGSRMTSTLYMRGIGARIDQPAVGLNVDNVPILSKDNYDFDLTDIERIEIVRGPQSTLYGRNTMAGVVNISTLSPLRFQGLTALAEYGRGDSWRVAAGVYGLVRPSLGMSLNAGYYSTEGFWVNEYTGRKIDFQRHGSLRWRTAYADEQHHLTVDNVAALTLSRQGGYPYASLATGIIAHNDTCFYHRTGITDGLTVQWRPTDRLTLSSITSFQYIDDNMTLDQDFLTDSYFTLTQKRREWAVTEDLVARGSVATYNWLAGAFVFGRHTSMDAPVTFLHDGIERLILGHRNEVNPYYPVVWDDDTFVLGSHFTAPMWGAALYHNSELTLGRWTLSGGVRLTYEHNALDYRSFTDTGFTTMERQPDGSLVPFMQTPVNIDDRGSLSKSSVELLPRVAATWRATDGVSVKASIARGYKSGGYNTQMFSDVLQQRIMAIMGMSMKYDVDQIIGYKPESSWNYEVGAQFTLGSVKADLAAFYIDCRNQQLTTFPDGNTTGRIMTNAGRTASAGVEASLSASLGRHFNASASYGYTHATFRRFFNGIADFAGKRLPYAPAHTAFAMVTYTTTMPGHPDHRLSVTANVRGVGDIWWDEANTARQPFYALLGASAEWQHKALSVQVWAENITNTRYDTFYFVSIGNAFVQHGRPWTAGATIRLRLDNFKW